MRAKPDRNAAPPAPRGLFRRELSPDARTLRALLAGLLDQSAACSLYPGLRIQNFALGPDDGKGGWRFIAVGQELVCVLTNCDFAAQRHEVVQEENFIEFHFLLEGPVTLAAQGADRDRLPTGASFLACGLSPAMTYTVDCEPGLHRKISLYVGSDLARGLLGTTDGGIADFLAPAKGTMAIIELPLTLALLECTRALMDVETSNPLGRLGAFTKVHELLTYSLLALQQRLGTHPDALTISQRDLELFARARDVLAGNLDLAMTAQSLARELGTNATKLKAGFKLVHGTTLFEYRTRVRMRHALELLRTTSKQVSEISRSVGYRHQGSFTKAFKEHFGLLPRAARAPGSF